MTTKTSKISTTKYTRLVEDVQDGVGLCPTREFSRLKKKNPLNRRIASSHLVGPFLYWLHAGVKVGVEKNWLTMHVPGQICQKYGQIFNMINYHDKLSSLLYN